MIWYILFISIFIILFIYLKKSKTYKNCKTCENYENISVDIGNNLSHYYYKYFISILKKEDFNYINESLFGSNKEVKNKNHFIDSLPKRIEFNETIYNLLKKDNIQYDDYKDVMSVAFWMTESKEKEKIHFIMKPFMHKIFDETYKKLQLNKTTPYPIIHFRCADTPFIKSGFYYLQKYEYFKKILRQYSYNNVTILSCTDHLSNERNKKTCEKYVELLKNELKDFNPIVKCGTNVDDFVSMFYAPLVISTQSSFSFMSGYFGNAIYIEPNTMIDNMECSDCESAYKGYNIPHSEVDDYHNVEDVYLLLI
jgi:hypothetical protein